MTRPEQKLREREALERFLVAWAEGPRWQLVAESDDADSPDALLRAGESSEVVAVEVTRYVHAPLAHADSVADAIARDLQLELSRRATAPVGVFLSFYEGSALAIGTGRARTGSVARMAEFVRSKLPLSGTISFDAEELEAETILAAHHIMLMPSPQLFAVKAGTTGHGVGVGVIQPSIDEKR